VHRKIGAGDTADGSEAVRCTGQHRFVGVTAVLDGQAPLLEGDAQIAAQFLDDLQADAVEDRIARRRQDRSVADDEEISDDRLGNEAVGVEKESGSARFHAAGLLVGDPPRETATLLDARIDAFGRDAAGGRRDEDGTLTDEAVIAREGQREGMDTESWRPVAGAARFAEIVADGARRGEENDREIAVGRQESGVIGDELFGDGGQLVVRKI